MIIVLKKHITKLEKEKIENLIRTFTTTPSYWKNNGYDVIGLLEQDSSILENDLKKMKGIEKIIPIKKEYKRIASELPPRIIKYKGVEIGKNTFNVIAGPCTVKSYDELKKIAVSLKKMGINLLRAGAYKLRTSPYNFQGLGNEGLKIIKQVCDETGMLSVSEVISLEDVELVSKYIDIVVVGTRNMYSYPLLKKIGKIKNPVILKRGFSATLEEWLLAAEYIAESGNPNIILCERGIRTFERYTRNTLDISMIPAVKTLSNLPIIIDPSHSTGRSEMVKSVCWAAMAAGADGLIIEAHYNPVESIVDSRQTINLEILEEIVSQKERLTNPWNKY
jgi:3-deoxy-7-phosphoheptulonate synthase